MAVIKELIKSEKDGAISFGDYTLSAKTKKDDFSFDGDIYKIKTFNEITKLERNEMFVYESVPGSSVSEFKQTGDVLSFNVEASEDINITLELSPECEYDITVDGADAGKMKTNFSGKLSFSVELDAGVSKEISIKKIG